MKDTKTETNTSFSGNTKTKDKVEETQEVKETAVKKEAVPEVKNTASDNSSVKASAPVTSSKPTVKAEKSIDEMTDAEIEAYMKKRKAEKDSFTIVNEDIPMHKLIRASVPPPPALNKEEMLRTVIFRQNKLERDMKKKV